MYFDINNLDFINTLVNSLTFGLSLIMLIFITVLIYILLYKLDLKSTELRLILFLSCIELLFGTQMIISSISKLVYGYHIFDAENVICQVHGTFMTGMVRYEIVVVTVLALWRYLLAVYNIDLKFYVCIGIVVLLGLVIFGINIYGALNQTLKPGSSYLICLPFASPGLSYFVLNAILTFINIFQCWATIFFYFSIGLKANKKLNQLKAQAKETSDLDTFETIPWQRIQLILQLVLVFILYNIDFIFTYISYILRLANGNKRSPSFDALVYFAFCLLVMATPVVTVSFQPDIKNELKVIFVKFEAKLKKLYINMFNRE